MGLTQKDIALTSGTGLRFISDLERGKATCQLGKTLAVLNTLGVNMTFELPPPLIEDKAQKGGAQATKP